LASGAELATMDSKFLQSKDVLPQLENKQKGGGTKKEEKNDVSGI
jgi:hypothetical protein